MNRKVTVVGGAGNVGATVARAVADKQLADVVIIDIADQKATGRRPRHLRGLPDRRVRRADHRGGRRRSGLEGDGQLGRRRHHLGHAAQAGDEPRRSAADELQDHAVGDRAGRQVLAEHDHRAGRQPARRHVPGGLPPQQVPARARHRDGRRPRLGPHARLHRDGAERLRREHSRVRARRPRRHDGAAAALLDGRRHPHHRADARRSASTPSRSGRPTAAPRSQSWSAPAPGTRRARRPRKWSRRS